MGIGRASMAHLSSVMIGSLAIMLGVEAIEFGSRGLITGLSKWIGGILIFVILATITLPIGLFVRWCMGKLRLDRMRGSLYAGAGIGFGTIFVLHPAMYPPMSFFTHPISLTVVHVAAGLIGAWVWQSIEPGSRKVVTDE